MGERFSLFTAWMDFLLRLNPGLPGQKRHAPFPYGLRGQIVAAPGRTRLAGIQTDRRMWRRICCRI